MKTRSSAATGSALAASPTARRELRPRQAPGVQGQPAGATTPRPGGRVTRSTASQPNPDNDNQTSPQLLTVRTSARQSHKRSTPPSTPSGSCRAKRARRQSEFYGEENDSGNDAGSGRIFRASVVEQSGPSKPNPARPTKRRPSRAANVISPLKSRPKLSPSKERSPVFKDLVIPAWATLPYHVLTQIFRYAAISIEETDRAKWLNSTSRVCRSFAEPALTVLYESPPLLNRPMAHGLVSLLSQDPSTTMFNYRAKVEELWIGVEEIASKTYKGQPLDFGALVGNLPRLKFIQFYHSKDDPPFRSLDESLRWHYPPALFRALNGAHDQGEGTGGERYTKLEGWQWNRRLMGPDLGLAGIKALHHTPPFANLKKVSFLNYQVPSLLAKRDSDDADLAAQDRAFVESMAQGIAALPALEFLSIESSTAANGEMLPLLPKTLKILELVNCWEVNGDDFSSYLLSNGHSLEHIILRHNQSLSMSFLTVLGTACPRLQTLRVDCKTFNHHEFYRDSDPNYDNLLTADQIPNWPESLRALELKNMRKWTAEAAETLFQSLVDSAPKLLSLRHLVLKAMLDIPYRQRSQIRDKWAARLKQVFLREQTDPKPLFSLRQQQQTDKEVSTTSATEGKTAPRRKSSRKSPGTPSRRSGRIAAFRASPHASSRASSVGRDLRHGLGRPSYAEPDTDVDDDEDDDVEEGTGEEKEEESSNGSFGADGRHACQNSSAAASLFRHGMCEKVEIQLDNQKPAEKTFGMEDFLDSEADDLSDEDWDGDDEDLDVGYAW
ncbi:hypothetical protein VTK26DRAFT_7525 [Humicola hyalothermophila]